jgi:ABC-type glutathione transport system ATPase component
MTHPYLYSGRSYRCASSKPNRHDERQSVIIRPCDVMNLAGSTRVQMKVRPLRGDAHSIRCELFRPFNRPAQDRPVILARDAMMRFPSSRRNREGLLSSLKPRKVVTALQNITCDIHFGDRIPIMGPNGAGETTLLRLNDRLLFSRYGSITCRPL